MRPTIITDWQQDLLLIIRAPKNQNEVKDNYCECFFGTKLKLANMWTPQHSQLQVIVLEIPQTHENSPF